MLGPLPAATLIASRNVSGDDGTWVGISGRGRVVVYNTAAIAYSVAELPADIAGFCADSRWAAARLGADQRLVPGLWSPPCAYSGVKRTRQWLEGIQANEPMSYEGNTQIVEAVAASEVDAGFVNHYYLYRFLAEQGETFP